VGELALIAGGLFAAYLIWKFQLETHWISWRFRNGIYVLKNCLTAKGLESIEGTTRSLSQEEKVSYKKLLSFDPDGDTKFASHALFKYGNDTGFRIYQNGLGYSAINLKTYYRDDSHQIWPSPQEIAMWLAMESKA